MTTQIDISRIARTTVARIAVARIAVARIAVARVAFIACAVLGIGGCERAGTGPRSHEGSNAIVSVPADASIADARIDAADTPRDAPSDASTDAPIVIITKSDLPVWPVITGPKVTVPRGGTRSLAGVSFTFAGYGSGVGPNGGLAMIGLVAAKGGVKQEVNVSSRGGAHDPEFVVFDRGFVMTSIGGESIEIIAAPKKAVDCTKLIDALVDKLGIREPPKPDEITGFTISGDGITSQTHHGITIECGSVSGGLAVVLPGSATP